MGSTAVGIINAGLRLIGAGTIRSIAPPGTDMEFQLASDDGYASWRDQELTKRRWVFATEYLRPAWTSFDAVSGIYAYVMPGDLLRPIRDRQSTWMRKGRYLYDRSPTLAFDAIMRKPEGEFDPLFVPVLAARVAMEMCEEKTQSDTKFTRVSGIYRAAIDAAGRVNSFVIGPEDISLTDDHSSWITSRNTPSETGW